VLLPEESQDRMAAIEAGEILNNKGGRRDPSIWGTSLMKSRGRTPRKKGEGDCVETLSPKLIDQRGDRAIEGEGVRLGRTKKMLVVLPVEGHHPVQGAPRAYPLQVGHLLTQRWTQDCGVSGGNGQPAGENKKGPGSSAASPLGHLPLVSCNRVRLEWARWKERGEGSWGAVAKPPRRPPLCGPRITAGRLYKTPVETGDSEKMKRRAVECETKGESEARRGRRDPTARSSPKEPVKGYTIAIRGGRP